jgi:hypothetical protein
MKIKELILQPWYSLGYGKSGFPFQKRDEGETVVSRGFNWISDVGLLNQLE